MEQHEQHDTEAADDGAAIWESLTVDAVGVDEKAGLATPEQLGQQEVEEAAAGMSTGELVGTAIQATADFIAPNWDIQPEESAQLGEAYGALLDKYLPDSGLDKYGAEITALLVTGMILKSRAGIPMKKPKPKEPEKAESGEAANDAAPEQVVRNATTSGVL